MVTKNSKTRGRKSGRQTKAASNTKRSSNVRLTKEQAEKRYAEADAFFTKTPDAPGTAFNKVLADRGEPQMNIAKVYELRAKARQKRRAQGTVAPAQATGTNGAEAAPVIPAAEFENARRIAGVNVRARAGATVLPFVRVKEEASKLWKLMRATGVESATIVGGKVHLSGKYQMTEELA